MNDIFIIGQIGSTYNEDGTINIKGVELEDVVNDFEKIKDSEIVNVFIDSAGGSVNVGNLIASYLSSFPNVVTIASNVCMSIATKIHLCVPLENRKIIAGTNYTIHCPLLPNFSGNSDEMLQASKMLKPIETEMISMYVKSTGLSKEAVSGLMKQETTLTNEQVISMGFASEILPNYKYKAVAFIDLTQKNMNKKTGFLASILAMITGEQSNGRTVQALILETDKGNLETPFSDLLVGDPALLDGANAPAGTYTMTDGTTFEVDENGVITSITNVSPEVNELMAQMTIDLDNLKTENETLKAQITTMETEQAEVVALLKTKGTSFQPVVSQVVGKFNKPKEISFKEQMEARKNDYKQNKK